MSASQIKFDYFFLPGLRTNLSQVPQVNLTNSYFTIPKTPTSRTHLYVSWYYSHLSPRVPTCFSSFFPTVLLNVVFCLPLRLLPSGAQLLLQPCPRIWPIIFHRQINVTSWNSSFFLDLSSNSSVLNGLPMESTGFSAGNMLWAELPLKTIRMGIKNILICQWGSKQWRKFEANGQVNSNEVNQIFLMAFCWSIRPHNALLIHDFFFFLT